MDFALNMMNIPFKYDEFQIKTDELCVASGSSQPVMTSRTWMYARRGWAFSPQITRQVRKQSTSQCDYRGGGTDRKQCASQRDYQGDIACVIRDFLIQNDGLYTKTDGFRTFSSRNGVSAWVWMKQVGTVRQRVPASKRVPLSFNSFL